MRINPVGIAGVWQPPQLTPKGVGGAPAPAAPASAGPTFQNSLTQALRQVNELQLQAEDLAQALAAGQAQDLHQVMLAAEKANLSLQFTLQIRNKVIEAYQEIMRIQV
ncbi:MAG: flagellar hook-basal body complex protein FliE [Bacillota bacterium]|nr:flagellar hook-basal body complex protein FliE [Bacillota bacterium]